MAKIAFTKLGLAEKAVEYYKIINEEEKIKKEEQREWWFRLERKKREKKNLVISEQKGTVPLHALGTEILTS